MTTPDYNTDCPRTLVARGLLNGRAVHVNTSSIASFDARTDLRHATVSVEHPKEAYRGGVTGSVAIKLVHDQPNRIPRNVRREALLMAKMNHPNVIALWNAYLLPTNTPTDRHFLFMPLYDYSLRDLLDNEAFAPTSSQDEPFHPVVNSLARQLIDAVAYVHGHGIAHRDINPSNVVLSRRGRVILIDFGISIERGDELPGEMHFQIGTQPYRAPELVFASRNYEAQAVDIWALGTTLAEFLLPVVTPSLRSSALSDLPSPHQDGYFSTSSSDDEYDEAESRPRRQRLFEPNATDFALAASIFKVLGTPNDQTWPESRELPTFKYFKFDDFRPQALQSLLVNAPRERADGIISLIEGLLVYSSTERLTARQALMSRIWETAAVVKFEESEAQGPLDELMKAYHPV
ncbi:hypothetical protein ACM66B_004145 [Microbotryomycetes sp. NB124-2]